MHTLPKHKSVLTKILLVDDHQIVLWGLERLIESEKKWMKVVGKATNCAEAIELAAKVKPDIVLLDTDLGTECGVDAIAKIIARSNAKVVALTSKREDGIQDKAVLAGARGVVGKEEPVDNILKAITKVQQGEFWLDRATTGRIFLELSRMNTSNGIDTERLKIANLTSRELEIVRAVATDTGVTTDDFAGKLKISKHTLRNHLTNIYEKLGVANRIELYTFANKHFF